MTTPQRAGEQIIEEVTSWPGVSAAPGSRGELSLQFGRREIGHLHGDHAAHFAFLGFWRSSQHFPSIGGADGPLH